MMLGQFQKVEEERLERIHTAKERYYGTYPKPLKSTPSDRDGDDNTTVNFAKLIVNKGVSFLFGFDLDFEVNGEKESDEETWLEACLDANSRMTLLHKLGVNGGICGDAFIKVRLPDEGRYGHKYPKLTLWDPANVSVRWSPEDCEEILSYTYSWHGVDPVSAQPVAYRQVIEKQSNFWTIRDEESRGSSRLWTLRQDGESRWSYPWAPVFHCQNLPAPHEYWGLADLEGDILHLNDAVNFVLSNTRRIYRIHGHPKVWAKGVHANQFQMGIDDVVLMESDHAELRVLEVQGALTDGLELGRQMSEALHELARIPEVATGKVQDLGQLSGLALKILYGPLVEVTETKRLTYGEMLQNLCARLLELGNFKGAVVKPQWPSIVPSDPKGDAETAVLLQSAGVSRDTTLSKLGFDPEAEATATAKERKSAEDVARRALKDVAAGRSGPLDEGDEE